jgi:predicted GNAT family acetyltransferase
MTADPASTAVRDNPGAQRYEVESDGWMGILKYEPRPGAIALIHTEVPPALRGRGLADLLARFALEKARADGLRVIPICPFVKAFIKRHPEYQPLVQT